MDLTAKKYVQLTRPQNVSGSVITYCLGYILVTKKLSYDFFVGLVILLALHSLATLQNDIEDFEIDRANKRKGALQDESLTVNSAIFFLKALSLLALVLALLSAQRRLHLAALGGLLVIAWLYNANPIRASKKPLLSIFTMGVCYGVLPFIYGYFLAGGKIASNYFFAFVILWFLARVSTAIMKDYKDATGDKLFGKETFYLHYGSKKTAQVSIIACGISYIGILVVFFLVYQQSILFTASILLAGILATRNVAHRVTLLKYKDVKLLNKIFHQSVFRHNQFEASVLLCLMVSSK